MKAVEIVDLEFYQPMPKQADEIAGGSGYSVSPPYASVSADQGAAVNAVAGYFITYGASGYVAGGAAAGAAAAAAAAAASVNSSTVAGVSYGVGVW